MFFFFFFQAEDGIRDGRVTGVQTCALPISGRLREANRITRERLLLLPSMDRNDPYCAPEICNTYGRACIYAIMAGDLPDAMAAARAGIDDDLLRDTHITASRLVQPLVLTGRFRDAIGYAERMWDQWERAGRPAPLWMLAAVCTTVLACAMLEELETVALWRSHAAEVAGGTAARRGGTTRGRRPARRGEWLGDGLPRPCARTPTRRSRRADSRTHGVGTPGRASGTRPHANVAGAALVTRSEE